MTTLVTEFMTNHHVPADLIQLRATLQTWVTRYRQRRELAQWSDRDLNDIGQSWSSVADEVNKPFWQA